jgi:UDP-2-acetamido-3-amino-2,3-dideoxy-glucuronate N-acetyltransferase
MVEPFVHPTAVVDAGVELGEGAKVWHFAHVCTGAQIGARCSLGQNVYVAPGVVLGVGCKVQNNVSLYEGVTCEDEVFLGPSMVFTNVINPRAAIVRRGEFRSTLIQRGATVGANATIICGVTLGEYCFIGAGAVVTRDVPAYALVLGVPGTVVGWVSASGHRLSFDSEGLGVCPETGTRYQWKDGIVSKAS